MNEKRKSWIPFNGKETLSSRIFESLIIALLSGGLASGLVMWKNTSLIDQRMGHMEKMFETKLNHLCENLTKLEGVARGLDNVVNKLNAKDETQEYRINALERKVYK